MTTETQDIENADKDPARSEIADSVRNAFKAGASMNGDAPVYSESRHIPINLRRVADNRCVCAVPDSREMDTYKVLRAQIQHRMKEKGWKAVLITSACPGEGKTLTAINLAFTFAVAYNQTAMLVDCDLRRQSVHRYLGIEQKLSLVDYFVDDVPLKDIICWPGVDKLTLISGDRTVSDSTEFLGSPKMNALVQEMKARYPDRYLIFDAPPVLFGADVISFAPCVDCILMVVEAGRTPIQDIRRSLEMLPRDKMLGFAMNRQKSGNGTYYGRRGYPKT